MAPNRPISLLIAALGGEGGGVLSKWVVDIAESQDYLVQFTSIPGVAQRTGATTYYVEMYPERAAREAGAEPVMALMPGPGEVDVLLASEIMEAGRVIQRGFISPERSTVITSTHRVYAITEKGAMGDGRFDPAPVIEAARQLSKTLIQFDMAALAKATGSVINAVLLGALAASEALPFPRQAFEDAIRHGGIAVDANLAGFAAGFEAARGQIAIAAEAEAAHPRDSHDDLPPALAARLAETFPEPTRDILGEGLRRLIDFQDTAYADQYLTRLEPVLAADRAAGGAEHDFALTRETGRYLALWMSFEDVIRVADLKTRPERHRRLREEVGATPDQIVEIAEFLRPGVEEMVSILPPALARLILGSKSLRAMLGKLSKGRQVRTTSISGFLLLWLLARLRRFRRRMYRFREEQVRIDEWLARVCACAARDYTLAMEVAACARLIKGYGETNARGLANYRQIMAALDRLADEPALARHVKELRQAALADEDGLALAAALQALPGPGDSATTPARAAGTGA